MSRAVLILLLLPLTAQDRLTPEERRGRQIYELGTSASGATLEASLDGDSRVPASILPCSNCHGRDGLGRPEGGVTPSNITWDALTKPYGLTHPDGRGHAPYTERLLKRAITMGIDPSGNTLSNAMPRFQLSLADASDLIAYIKRLGDALDPGLTSTTVHLGVVLPPASPIPNTSGIARQVLLEYFARANADGGVFGRRIELIFAELPTKASQRTDAVREFLNRQQVFAVLGDFTSAESGIAGVMRDTGTPAIPALDPFPETSSPLNPYVFYLDGGLKEELEALAKFASEQLPRKDTRIAIVASSADIARAAGAWVQTRLLELGLQNVSLSDGARIPQADFVFWLRPELSALAAPAEPDRKTVLLIPGSLAGDASALAPTPSLRIFIALRAALPASLPGPDATRVTWERVTASAAILTEAMKLAGRNLSRASLISALEGFQLVRTSLPGPVSFGPGRRIGASGVRIMMLESPGGKLIPVP